MICLLFRGKSLVRVAPLATACLGGGATLRPRCRCGKAKSASLEPKSTACQFCAAASELSEQGPGTGAQYLCRKTFTAPGAARCNHLSPPHRRHPGAEPVAAFAHKLAWLICPLHCAAPPTNIKLQAMLPPRRQYARTAIATPTVAGSNSSAVHCWPGNLPLIGATAKPSQFGGIAAKCRPPSRPSYQTWAVRHDCAKFTQLRRQTRPFRYYLCAARPLRCRRHGSMRGHIQARQFFLQRDARGAGLCVAPMP
jgi:hypothetical protein